MMQTSKLLSRKIHDVWGLFLAEGVILVIFGFFAMLLPVTGLVVAILWDGC